MYYVVTVLYYVDAESQHLLYHERDTYDLSSLLGMYKAFMDHGYRAFWTELKKKAHRDYVSGLPMKYKKMYDAFMTEYRVWEEALPFKNFVEWLIHEHGFIELSCKSVVDQNTEYV